MQRFQLSLYSWISGRFQKENCRAHSARFPVNWSSYRPDRNSRKISSNFARMRSLSRCSVAISPSCLVRWFSCSECQAWSHHLYRGGQRRPAQPGRLGLSPRRAGAPRHRLRRPGPTSARRLGRRSSRRHPLLPRPRARSCRCRQTRPTPAPPRLRTSQGSTPLAHWTGWTVTMYCRH